MTAYVCNPRTRRDDVAGSKVSLGYTVSSRIAWVRCCLNQWWNVLEKWVAFAHCTGCQSQEWVSQERLFIQEAAISGDRKVSLKFTPPSRIRLGGFCVWQPGESWEVVCGLHTCNQLHPLSLVTHKRDVIYTLVVVGVRLGWNAGPFAC